MHITSRIALHLSTDPKKPQFISLKMYESGIFLDHHPIGTSVEEACDTLNACITELIAMQVAKDARVTYEKKQPTCPCAETQARMHTAGDLAKDETVGCSVCADLPRAAPMEVKPSEDVDG